MTTDGKTVDAMTLRPATRGDIPALEALIRVSGVVLSLGAYTRAQAEAMTAHVYGVDTQLIDDGTYFAIEDTGAETDSQAGTQAGTQAGRIVACGGWSRRGTLFGADRTKSGEDPLLDPAHGPARIRAFFVAPEHARRGLGRRLLAACEDAARAAGFTRMELVSTAPGEPLYLAAGYRVAERFELHLPGGVDVPVSRMARTIAT